MFKKIGDGCGGFIAVDEYIAFFMELQWARILVKLEGKELPSSLEIVVRSGCFAIQLWWETHPSFVQVVSASKNCMAGSSRVREAIEEKPRADYCGDLRERVVLPEVQRGVQDVSLHEGRQKGVGADTTVVAIASSLPLN